MNRLAPLAALLLTASAARADEIANAVEPEPVRDETIGPAIGAGVNLTPKDPGWQLQLAIMGENLDKALLTQISLAYEVVGTRLESESAASGRISQVVLNPFTIWGGYAGLRLGAGFDVAYAFLPVGASAESAKGWGVGGRVGGGLSMHTDKLGFWLLAQYRFLSGVREGGLFVDLLVGLQ